MRTSLHQVYTPTPHHHSLNTTVTYLSLRNCYPNYTVGILQKSNREERMSSPSLSPRISRAHQPPLPLLMPIRRHQDPHHEVSPAPLPLLMPIWRHQDPHHESTGKKRKAPCRRGGDEAVEQLVDLTEIRKRRKVTTDRRYNKKYAENNIRYAKQVVQWLVVVAKTSNL